MPKREPPVERFYAPEDLHPDAPRLYVALSGHDWQVRDEDGVVLSTHPSQADAIEAGCERSRVRFSEILVRGATGRVEWLVDQGPVWAPIADYYLRRNRRRLRR